MVRHSRISAKLSSEEGKMAYAVSINLNRGILRQRRPAVCTGYLRRPSSSYQCIPLAGVE